MKQYDNIIRKSYLMNHTKYSTNWMIPILCIRSQKVMHILHIGNYLCTILLLFYCVEIVLGYRYFLDEKCMES